MQYNRFRATGLVPVTMLTPCSLRAGTIAIASKWSQMTKVIFARPKVVYTHSHCGVPAMREWRSDRGDVRVGYSAIEFYVIVAPPTPTTIYNIYLLKFLEVPSEPNRYVHIN